MDSTRVHAYADDALGEHDATALAGLLAAGALSRREVLEAAIARIEKVQPELNAVRHADFEGALAAPPGSGPFAGVPTFIKDNTDVAGLPSQHGSTAFTARPAAAHAPISRLLLGLGLANLGKSTLPEFGFNASTEYAGLPPTRNPWNPAYSSGASSGGSAALVASGAVPLAHANDGGGSIRIPAAACGLVGLKPTRGRFPAPAGHGLLPVGIVSEGVLTRSVRDTARVFTGIERTHRPSGGLMPAGGVEGPGRRRLRIGLVLDSITGQRTDDETRTAVEEAARLLEGMGHQVSPVEITAAPTFPADFALYWELLAHLLSSNGKRMFARDFDRRALDPLTAGLARQFRTHRRRLPGAVLRLRRTKVDYARMFTGADVVLSPVLAHTTPPLGHLSPEAGYERLFAHLTDYVAFTPFNNTAGGPGLSLPMGRTADGLPIGVHFSAAHGDERTLLQLAFEIEEAVPWRRIQDRES
ncbi:amidase [Streptomyces physcomitrii]|uniref:amidase n=1 Tax=Streptomyces physcomitrii TaxID=2724184 RepID=UPI0034055208